MFLQHFKPLKVASIIYSHYNGMHSFNGDKLWDDKVTLSVIIRNANIVHVYNFSFIFNIRQLTEIIN